MEHRCGYRRPVSVRARLRTRGGLIGSATISEVSASGGRIDCDLPLAAHSVVILDFAPTGVAGARRESLEAEVVRITDCGYAVEWLEFASQVVRNLCRPGEPLDAQQPPSAPMRHGDLRSH